MFRYPPAMKAVPGVALAVVLAAGVVLTNRSRDDARTALYLQARDFYRAVGEGRPGDVADKATPEGREAARDLADRLRRLGGGRSVITSVVVEPEGVGRVHSGWLLGDGREVRDLEDVWRRDAGGTWRFAAPVRRR